MSVMMQIWRRWKRPWADDSSLEYVPGGWPAARNALAVRGWNTESVVQIQSESLERWLRPLKGTDPLGSGLSASPSDLGLHNTLVSFAYVVALAARNRSRCRLLDWGGGAGQYGWLAESVVPDLELEYCCQDVPVQCVAGRQLFPHGTFYSSDEEWSGRRFDLVLASGSLQYVEDWSELLARLAAASERYLFVTRLPVVVKADSYLVLQRAYQSEYLGWTLNRDEFLQAANACGLHLVREFLLGESHRARGAPEASHSRGFLFRT